MRFSTKQITLVSLFVALITIGSKITIPSPLVPFTLQWMFVALSGLLLGSRLGFITMIVYIVLGLAGVPVFAKGGGITYIFAPSFGYLIGFALAAYVIGKYTENAKEKLSAIKLLAAVLTGLLIVYTCGVSYLFLIKNFYIGSAMTINKAIWYGAVLFMPTDILFSVLCAIVGSKVAYRIKSIIGN